jgi:hypothetical protein
MTVLVLWLVVLAVATLWGGIGWWSAHIWRRRLDDEMKRHTASRREHWKALSSSYGATSEAASEAARNLARARTVERLLLRYHEALEQYAGEDDTATDADALLLNEGRVHLETAGLLKPERREAVS